jgi:acyl-CoA thioester hydrolase
LARTKKRAGGWKLKKLTASVDVEIAFYDTDAMGVVWHGNYLKYFELARCALLQKFEYNYLEMLESGYLWPIVECQLKYMHSGVFGQPLRVEATLVEYENRLKIVYQIVNRTSGEKLTKGYTVQVAVNAKTRELQFVSPEVVFKNLEKIGITR